MFIHPIIISQNSLLIIVSSYKDTLKHTERRRTFNFAELKRLVATSIHQKAEDIIAFEKTRRRRLQSDNHVRWLSVHCAHSVPIEPKHHLVASEVVTMYFLRLNGIPLPRVFGYFAVSENTAGTEYIFMEFVHGTYLGNVWFDLSEKERII